MLFIIQKIDYPFDKQCCIEDFCPGNVVHVYLWLMFSLAAYIRCVYHKLCGCNGRF